jgi:site-specific DNA-methyltransferase (adenine-specific)
MRTIPDASAHLVVTSPPYAFLKEYRPGVQGQLGNILDYDSFLLELDRVWAECERILVPGGRVTCVVGDVCLSRRRAKRHYVLPLSADIQVRARRLGLDCLTPIRWYKVSNIALEASRSSVFLGKPNLPGGVIKNDIEHILLLRKPGAYRSPSDEMNRASHISTDDYTHWFRSIWTDVAGQLRTDHPAPYPIEVPRRLIRMFSFAGDLVVDPFAGTGTTALAAWETGRSSISYEIDPVYLHMAEERLKGSKVPVVRTSAAVEAKREAARQLSQGDREGVQVDDLLAQLEAALEPARTAEELRRAVRAVTKNLKNSQKRLSAG